MTIEILNELLNKCMFWTGQQEWKGKMDVAYSKVVDTMYSMHFVDLLEQLQKHPCNGVYEISYQIAETHF